MLLLFPGSRCFASTDSLRVDSIVISGNEKTEDDVILRELTFGIGDTVTAEVLKYNKERIFSLSLFTSVRLRAIRRGQMNIVQIDVEESWYIWPVPFASIKDNTIKKLTYGVSLLYKNFRGKNETLTTTIGLGYDPSFGVSYYNPWISRGGSIFLSTGLSYQNLSNKSIEAAKLYGSDFKQRFISYYLTIGKRFNLFNELSATGGFTYVKNPDNNKSIAFPKGSINRSFMGGITYTFDNRNLKQFPDSGFYAMTSLSYYGFGQENVSYGTFRTDIRHYFRIWEDFSFKWRLTGRYTAGKNIPFFQRPMLGVDEHIRGYYSVKQEGEMYYVASAELRYPLIKEWSFKYKLPLVPNQLTRYRIKVYVDVFGDTGSALFRDEKPSLNKLYSGYGAGIVILLLPYNAARIDYAFNEYKTGELIFGLGFSF